MKVVGSVMTCAAGAALILVLGAAQRPTALARVGGGLWEIDRLGPGVRPRICVPDPMILASYEHRGQTCTRLVIGDRPEGVLVHYTCAGGGFGRSKIDVLTPRSIRIETQGISNDLPFNYVIQARRVGECGPRQSAAAH
jgi:hypothetical protein